MRCGSGGPVRRRPSSAARCSRRATPASRICRRSRSRSGSGDARLEQRALSYLRDNLKYGLGASRAGGPAPVPRARRRDRRRARPGTAAVLRSDDGPREAFEQRIAARRPADRRGSAAALSPGADLLAWAHGGRRAPAQASGRPGHLHHRSQRQLHERLRRALQLLRVLSRGRRTTTATCSASTRSSGRSRRRARWAASSCCCRADTIRSAARVVRGSVPRGQAEVPGLQAARAVAAGGDSPLADVEAAGARGDRSPDRRRARQHSRRRRRDPRRSRPQAAQLLQQGERRRVARRDAACAPRRACARRRR